MRRHQADYGDVPEARHGPRWMGADQLRAVHAHRAELAVSVSATLSSLDVAAGVDGRSLVSACMRGGNEEREKKSLR